MPLFKEATKQRNMVAPKAQQLFISLIGSFSDE